MTIADDPSGKAPAGVGICPHAARLPPMPPARSGRPGFFAWIRAFRNDILSAQPARLYRAWMAEFRMPFFTSFLCNDPELVDLVLSGRPEDFPKSTRLFEGMVPLLGHSIFITSGEEWSRQRRIIDPAFESGRVREVFPAMWDAAVALRDRLAKVADGQPVNIEQHMSHVTLDVIFRALFSLPIESAEARTIFDAFRRFQQSRPMVNTGSLLPLPRWVPRWRASQTRESAAVIRRLIRDIVDRRAAEIAAGTAPDDLATRIMTTPDPEDGRVFTPAEMADQVGIFVLAGHETTAAALSWALYLMATHPEWQGRVAEEARRQIDPERIYFSTATRLKVSRVVFRESLRLYPSVPMFLREARKPEVFRGRKVPKGSIVILSPWHLHRHERLWDNPHGFDPTRWERPDGRESARKAYIPFSAGLRVCPGSAFAMTESTLILSMVLRHYTVEPVEGREPVPVAQVTVRGKDGIWLRLKPRS